MTIGLLGRRASDDVAIRHVRCDAERLIVELSDGRQLAAPLARYPRLAKATAEQRDNWRLIGRGYGIHWPDVDEDISLDMLLWEKPSLETDQGGSTAD